MELDLRTIFPLSEPDETGALDLFISERLYEAGIWGSPRRSDGILRVRVLEFESACVRVCGWIYEIDQTLHSFWLDLQREASGASVSWALYFNAIASTPRDTRNAIDLHDCAEQLEWQVALVGREEVREGAIVESVMRVVSISPKWSRHTSTFDEDSIRFLSIVQYFLIQYFGNSEAAAEQAMDEFMADTSWGEDDYHREGAYRSAGVIHYSRVLAGDPCYWHEWMNGAGHSPTPEEARKYFWDHYLESTPGDDKCT